MPAFIQMVSQVARHALAVICDQNKAVVLTPAQQWRIECTGRRRIQIAHPPDEQNRLTIEQTSAQDGIDIFVKQITDRTQGSASAFCSLSFNARSRVTTGGGLRCCSARVSRLYASQSLR